MALRAIVLREPNRIQYGTFYIATVEGDKPAKADLGDCLFCEATKISYVWDGAAWSQQSVAGSGGGTANFLRADGTWAAPAGGGGGNATVSHLVAYASLSKTMTNIGTAYKDIYVSLTDLGNDKFLIDFGGAASFRIVYFWDYVGTGSQQVRWVDLANNANVLWEAAAFTADRDGTDSGWLTLPAWATGDKTIEWQGKSTTAADDPVAKGFRIYLK